MPTEPLSARDIAHRLRRAAPQPVGHETPYGDNPGAKEPAAVLLPLFHDRGQWHLLFIRRARNSHDRHSGEVAFPGGRMEVVDQHRAGAALREAREEIGLDSARVELLGELPELLTSSNFLVTPVIGNIPWPLALTPDPREVARIFSIPLGWLADPANHETRRWTPPGRRKARDVVFFDEFEGERLWGVSARITLNLVRTLRLTGSSTG